MTEPVRPDLSSQDPDWWRQAVLYQIYPRSFADSDGDGVGDLPGITSRLGHLAELGVDALWLSPFYPSQLKDGGYDVADYRDVDPLLGTLDDFDELSRTAHSLGLKVVVDIVPNHSSDQHPWFQEALASPPGSPARDRYIFRPGRGPGGGQPPSDWEANFGGSAWQRVPDGEWYLHLFTPEQPDFNWSDEEVREDFRHTLRFWSDRGGWTASASMSRTDSRRTSASRCVTWAPISARAATTISPTAPTPIWTGTRCTASTATGG